MHCQGRQVSRKSPRNRVRPALEALEDRRLLSFAGALDFTTASQPVALATADLNHDGHADLVTANGNFSFPPTSGTVSILLGGAGLFQDSVDYAIGINPRAVLVRDVNGDGQPDVLVLCTGNIPPATGPGTVDVLLGNGDGTFRPDVSYDAGSLPNAFDLADFNGDGKPDLVVVDGGVSDFLGNVSGGAASVYLNNGDGTFAAAINMTTGPNPVGVAAADYTGDGKVDLAVSNYDPSFSATHNAVQLLAGNGDGTFGSPINLSFSGVPGGLASADFNRDGKPDLAVMDQGSFFLGLPSPGGVSIQLNNGDGSFRAAANNIGSGGLGFIPPVVGDVNGDGKPDLVAMGSSTSALPLSGGLAVYLGNDDGTFAAGLSLHGPAVGAVVVADFTGDGKADLVGTDQGTQGSVSLLLGHGDGTFDALPSLDFTDSTSTGFGGPAITAGDFNGDGRLDFLSVFSDKISTRFNPGAGPWGDAVDSAITSSTGPSFATLVTADFNKDGKLDVAAVPASSPTATVYLNTGGGHFQQTAPLQTYSYSSTPVAGDFNGDGNVDLALVSPSAVQVLLGNGDGTFRGAVASTETGINPAQVLSDDFNGDGRRDLLVVTPVLYDLTTGQMVPGNISLLPGNGDGSFGAPVVLSTGSSLNPSFAAVADMNQDGKPDLVVSYAGDYNATTQTFGPGSLGVLINQGNGSYSPASSQAIPGYYSSVLTADMDGDGKLDVVLQSAAGGANVQIFPGDGDGTLGTPYRFSSGPGYGTLVAGDFNGDHAVDLAKLSGQTVTLLTDMPAFDHVAVAGPSGAGAGATLTVTVSGLSKLGFPTGAYAGHVHFASSDASASLPADYTFGPADGGTRGFKLTLHKPGAQTVTVTDPTTGQTLGTLNVKVGGSLLVTAAGYGGGPEVKAYDSSDHHLVFDFFAYVPSFTGGVRIAVADVTGDGIPDIITGPGTGGGPDVRVFDGATGRMAREIMAYNPGFTGGIFVAAADVNGDGYADVITGAGDSGGPDVRVFSGKDGSLLREFMAYNVAFTGGVRVAAADVNGDGTPDIVTGAGPGGGPHVQVFSGKDLGVLRSFFAFNPAFTGGVYVAAGDVDGDGKAEVITGAGPGGGPNVRVFAGSDGRLLASWMAYNVAFTGGVRVGFMSDPITGHGDVLTAAGYTGGPHVRVWDGLDQTELDGFFAYTPAFTGGVFVGGG